MRKFLSFIIALSFAVLFSASVFAAPAPTLFVYNDFKKECGTFRDGDEYVRYDLPQGWQAYDYQKSQIKIAQAYCDELGYKNIGSIVSYYKLQPITLMTRPPNFPYKDRHFNYLLLVAVIVVGSAAVAGIVLFIKYKPAKN